jgi:DNA-binding MarR family transcriptional regulator
VRDARETAERRLFHQLQRSWSRHAALVTVLDEGDSGLDAAGRLLLGLIKDSGPIRPSELAEKVGLSRASVSRRVAALEADGLVEAQIDARDKRAALLRITLAGARRSESIVDDGAANLHELVDDFTEDELNAFARLLGRLNDRADTQLTEARPTPWAHNATATDSKRDAPE